MEAVKPKRRRRLATPPPDDTVAPTEDIYDQGVSNTFKNLKSATCLPLIHIASVSSSLDGTPTTPNAGGENPLYDLSDSPAELAEVNSIIEEAGVTSTIEGEPPSPPPPPVPAVGRRRKVGQDVKAALDKLDKLQRVSFGEYYQQYTPDAFAENNICTQPEESTVKIRVKMPSGVTRYKLKYTDKLYSMRDAVAMKESVTASKISFFINDNLVTEMDTVESLGLTVADTVEVYILAEEQQQESTAATSIHIKVQGKGGMRDVENIVMEPDESMDVMMKKFAETKGLLVENLTFHFDGDEISGTDTPQSLDMEDGDCVDVSGH